LHVHWPGALRYSPRPSLFPAIGFSWVCRFPKGACALWRREEAKQNAWGKSGAFDFVALQSHYSATFTLSMYCTCTVLSCSVCSVFSGVWGYFLTCQFPQRGNGRLHASRALCGWPTRQYDKVSYHPIQVPSTLPVPGQLAALPCGKVFPKGQLQGSGITAQHLGQCALTRTAAQLAVNLSRVGLGQGPCLAAPFTSLFLVHVLQLNTLLGFIQEKTQACNLNLLLPAKQRRKMLGKPLSRQNCIWKASLCAQKPGTARGYYVAATVARLRRV
jgi:hypothetical protein